MPFQPRSAGDIGPLLLKSLPFVEEPADVAVGRVALEGLARSMASADAWQATTVRAWNTAVALAGIKQRSHAERIRMKYARKVLRRALPAELVA